MKPDSIVVERRGHVAVVTINRPNKRNAFDELLFKALEKAAAQLNAGLPRAVVITGAGEKAFSAGFDVSPDNPMVKRIVDAASRKDPGPARELIGEIRRAYDGFTALPVPLIAAINGLAFGGGAELAVRCDLRVMDPGAVICFSETSLGLMPDHGGGAALAGLVGPSRAAELILTGRRVGTDEALAMGLANRISLKGRSLEEALSLAETIAANGPRAVRSALAVIRERQSQGYRAMLSIEAELAAALISSGECFHGVAALLEKKKPVFPDIE